MSNQSLPIWAVQRINAVLAEEGKTGGRPTNKVLAKRTGLSMRLVRRCLVVATSTKLQAAYEPAGSPTPVDRLTENLN